MRKMKIITNKVWIVLICMFLLCITGCKERQTTMSGGDLGYYIPTTEIETEEEEKRYNMTDVAVIMDIDIADRTLTVKSINDEKAYLLYYTGGTNVLSKSGTELTMTQMSVGDIVDIYYVDGTQKLIKIQNSSQVWENSMAVGLTVNSSEKIIKFAGKSYKYDDGIVVISGSGFIGADEIVSIDEVTVRGVDTKILSIVVDKGHGYIQLTDTDKFEGGVVEVGKRITDVIESDMVLTVPEGTYTFAVANDGIGGSEEITIERDGTLPISLVRFKSKIDKSGLLKINITPDDAVLYIDGTATEYDEAVELTYGTHRIRIVSDTYGTYTDSITVDNTYTTVNYDMTEEGTTTAAEEEEETVVDADHKIYIYSSDGASVYFDGVYKGTTPVSFEKVTGTHTIILVKTGYTTKVYTVEIEDDDKDFIKIFDALVAS